MNKEYIITALVNKEVLYYNEEINKFLSDLEKAKKYKNIDRAHEKLSNLLEENKELISGAIIEIDETGKIHYVRIGEQVKDVERDLKTNKEEFIKMNLNEFLSLKNIYSKRVYQLLLKNREKGKDEISCLHLLELLNIIPNKNNPTFMEGENYKKLNKIITEIEEDEDLKKIYKNLKINKIIDKDEEKLHFTWSI